MYTVYLPGTTEGQSDHWSQSGHRARGAGHRDTLCTYLKRRIHMQTNTMCNFNCAAFSAFMIASQKALKSAHSVCRTHFEDFGIVERSVRGWRWDVGVGGHRRINRPTWQQTSARTQYYRRHASRKWYHVLAFGCWSVLCLATALSHTFRLSRTCHFTQGVQSSLRGGHEPPKAFCGIHPHCSEPLGSAT